jgi:hypothetical protein
MSLLEAGATVVRLDPSVVVLAYGTKRTRPQTCGRRAAGHPPACMPLEQCGSRRGAPWTLLFGLCCFAVLLFCCFAVWSCSLLSALCLLPSALCPVLLFVATARRRAWQALPTLPAAGLLPAMLHLPRPAVQTVRRPSCTTASPRLLRPQHGPVACLSGASDTSPASAAAAAAHTHAQRPWRLVQCLRVWKTGPANHGPVQARQRRGCCRTSSPSTRATRSAPAATC